MCPYVETSNTIAGAQGGQSGTDDATLIPEIDLPSMTWGSPWGHIFGWGLGSWIYLCVDRVDTRL